MATINYVKFLRGTPTAYANLATKDPYTLYFISATDATTGKLYIGDKEISTGGSGGSGVTTLAELTDIVLNTVQDQQILIYNSTSQKWENGFVSDIIDAILDSNVLVKNDDGELTLYGFDEAASGSVAQKGSDGKLKWVALTESYTKAEVDALVNGRLKRKKVSSLNDIDVSATDAEQYIYLVPATSTSSNNAFDEYIVVDGAIELLNSAPVDLADYVTTSALTTALGDYVLTSTYESEVGSLSDLVKDTGVTTVIGEINAINTRLTWVEMAE